MNIQLNHTKRVDRMVRWIIFPIFFGLLQLSSIEVNALDIPVPLCANVQDNGDVVISWQPPNDPGNLFFSYMVYGIDPATGNEIELAEILDYNNTTYTHVGAVAQIQSRTYFLRVKSGNTGQIVSGNSPEIHTMLLNVTAGGLNALATLVWNPPFDVIPSTSSGVYVVYRENAPGNWVEVGSTVFGEEFIIDTVQGICNDPPALINYRVEMIDNSGCSNISSIAGDLLTDGTGPVPPEIETVTVDTVSGNVVICWYPSPDPDTDGYIVQDNTDPDQFITIYNDTVTDITCFEHEVTLQQPNTYLVIAFDECGNDASFGTAHETMFLNAQLEECDQQVNLSWTPYSGWEEGVAFYEVQVSENGGNYEVAQTNSPGNTEQTIDVNPFSEYCFRVHAYSQGTQQPSVANTICLESTYPQTPEFVYLAKVDVTPENTIIVQMLPDNNAFMMDYRLERKAFNESEFEEIGIMAPNALNGMYQYIDEDVIPNELQYEYRVAAYDFCSNFFNYSNVSSNVLLTATEDNEEYLSKLKWNNYEIWDGGVSEYEIYRSLGRDGAFELLTSVPGNVSYYEDDVYDLIDTHGEFCYYIRAAENTNSFDRADTLRSNISCAVQKPLLWIPNAFIIGGENDIFKPVAGYLDFDRYSMQIYSRWGKQMFESKDIDVGWNGYHNGSVAPEGAYIYVISFRAGDGQTTEETGYVILLNALN